MGNTAFKCMSGGEAVQMVRVLLPDGNIVLLDGPVEVAELMIEHLNHMVIHCSTADSQAMGMCSGSMTIMQPGEVLQPGEAYLVHPIPPQFKMPLLKSQPLSLSKRKMAILSGSSATQSQQEDEKPQPKSILHRQRSLRLVMAALLQKSHGKVVDSSAGPDSEETKAALLDSDGCNNIDTDSSAVAKGPLQDVEEEEGVHFNMYMGWRPALESIPESDGYEDHDIPASPHAGPR